MSVRRNVSMRIKLPSVATVLASIALFVSLSGTAIAAGVVPLAKKALFANNAGKLQGKTAAAIAAMPGPAKTLGGMSLAEVIATPGPATSLDNKTAEQIAATPGPASTAAGLLKTATAPVSIAAQGQGSHTVACPAGTRALAGGWTTDATVLAVDSYPSSDSVWSVYLINLSNQTASGTLYAVCLA